MKRIIFSALFTAALVTGFHSYATDPVSIKSLLEDMIDRTALARYPDPAYKTAQFSSYDPATVSPDKPGWFANWDRTQFIRVDNDNGRREFVMMDATGPGALVRFWMTFAGKDSGLGTLRIYVDDMTVPVIEGAAFDVLSGGVVSAPPLATSVSELSPYNQRGHNLYFPIPYASRCKVTYDSESIVDGDWGGKRGECVYYNINYRTYESGTAVESYSVATKERYDELIVGTLSALRKKDRGLDGVRRSSVSLDAELTPGERKTIEMSGSRAVRRIGMSIYADDPIQALRDVVVEMSFDGERTVWIPAGDFFGIGPRRLYTNTWYTQAYPGGAMATWWVMPFEKECSISLINEGKQQVSIVDASVDFAPWKWDERSMHFGSSWHQYNAVETGGEKEASGDNQGIRDLNFVTLTGARGVYVGDGVALFNTAGAWWGEGDEKVWVDGESFPSHIGTGTEDYYGYAWCRPEPFTDHPFIAQPMGEGSFAPKYSVNVRVRALDAIPFDKFIQFDMELWHWAKDTKIDYAVSTFWYIAPGGVSNIAPDLEGVHRKVAHRLEDIIPNAK